MEKENQKLPKSDIRFRQRFSNFEKAYLQLEAALARDTSVDILLRAGLIQTFEYTFELAWKTMKDKLEFGGITAKLPRDVIKEAFQAGYITDGKMWIEALESRNEMSHLYDETLSKKAEESIRTLYAPILKEIYSFLKKSL